MAPHHRRNRLKLLISVAVLSTVLIVAAVAQRKHVASDPFAPDQTRARSAEKQRPVFGRQADPLSREMPLPERTQEAAPEEKPSIDTRASVAKPENVPADVLGFVEQWRTTLLNKNLDQHVATYAPRVDRFFNKRNVSRAHIRGEKAQMLGKYPDFNKYEVHDVKLESQTGNRAVVTFRKDWDTSGDKRFAGSERQRLTLNKTNGSWQITGEEELKVYWVRRS